jgi:hypothetical protein
LQRAEQPGELGQPELRVQQLQHRRILTLGLSPDE